jgi:hypothetical protein
MGLEGSILASERLSGVRPRRAKIVDAFVDDVPEENSDSAITQPAFSAHKDHIVHFADAFQFPLVSLTLPFAQNYTSLDYSVLGAVLGSRS